MDISLISYPIELMSLFGYYKCQLFTKGDTMSALTQDAPKTEIGHIEKLLLEAFRQKDVAKVQRLLNSNPCPNLRATKTFIAQGAERTQSVYELAVGQWLYGSGEQQNFDIVKAVIAKAEALGELDDAIAEISNVPTQYASDHPGNTDLWNEYLLSAVKFGDVEGVHKALNNGADINVRNWSDPCVGRNSNADETPIILASGTKYIGTTANRNSIYQCLLSHNADLSLTDKYGRSALHFLAYRGDRENCVWLFESPQHNNLINMNDRQGDSALSWAYYGQSYFALSVNPCIELLQAKGATIPADQAQRQLRKGEKARSEQLNQQRLQPATATVAISLAN